MKTIKILFDLNSVHQYKEQLIEDKSENLINFNENLSVEEAIKLICRIFLFLSNILYRIRIENASYNYI